MPQDGTQNGTWGEAPQDGAATPAPVAQSATQPAPAAPTSGWGTPGQTTGMGMNPDLTLEQAIKQEMVGDKDASMLGGAVRGVGEAAKGFGKGALDTAAGVGGIIRGGLNLVNSDLAEKVIPQQGLSSEQTIATPTNVMQKVGFAGEGLLEFIMGDEALKALPLSQRLGQASKIYKLLENSPRLLQALRAGTEASARSAIVAATQAIAHGASPEDAMKAAGITGTLAGVTGGIAGGVKATGKTLQEGVESQKILQEEAAHAPTSEEVRQHLSDTLKQSHEQMHKDFEEGVQDFSKRLAGQTHSMTQSPARTAAQDVLNEHAGGAPEHPYETQARQTATDRLDPKVKELVQNIARGEHSAPAGEILDTFTEAPNDPEAERLVRVNKFGNFTNLGVGTDPASVNLKPGEAVIGVKANGDWEWRGGDEKAPELTKPAAEGEKPELGDKVGPKVAAEFRAKTLPAPGANVDNLISLRQKLGEMARDFDYGDMNARAIRKVMNGIDDTIENLAKQANDPTLIEEYERLRAQYRTRVNAFDDPVVQKLMSNNAQEAADSFIKGSQIPKNYRNLLNAIGPEKTKEFGLEVYKQLLGDATNTDGSFDAGRFVDKMSRIPEEIKRDLFDMHTLPKGYQGARTLTDALLNNAKTASNMSKIAKALAGLGIASTPMSLRYMLGVSIIEGGINKAAKVLDEVANKPWVWRGLGMLGGAIKGGGEALGRITPALSYGAERGITQNAPRPQMENTPTAGGGSAQVAPNLPNDVNSGRWVDLFQKDGQFDADKMADFITKFEGSQVGRNNPGALKATTDDGARALGADLNPPRDAKGFLRFSSKDSGRQALIDRLSKWAADPKMQQLTPMEFINGKQGVYPGYSSDSAAENKNHPAATYAQAMLKYAQENQGGGDEGDSGMQTYDPQKGGYR